MIRWEAGNWLLSPVACGGRIHCFVCQPPTSHKSWPFWGNTSLTSVGVWNIFLLDYLTLLFIFFFPSVFLFADVPAPEQPELFLKKLQQCCTVFDFIDTLSDLKMKEYKRSTLNELVDYVTVSRGYLTEQAYPEVVKMVRQTDKHMHLTYTVYLNLCSLSFSNWQIDQNPVSQRLVTHIKKAAFPSLTNILHIRTSASVRCLILIHLYWIHLT